MTKIITEGNFPGPIIGGVRVDENYRPLKEPAMSEQLSRDDLLKQRLWAATNDCSALLKELAAFTDNPPHAADSQEEHVRYIESALQSLRYNCRKLREYKP